MKRSWIQFGVALIASLCVFITAISIYLGFRIPHMPRRPNAAGQLIYAINNHGVTHYISLFDHVLDVMRNLALISLISLCFGPGLLIVAWRSGVGDPYGRRRRGWG